MKRRGKITNALAKDSEISGSLYSSVFFLIIFSLWALARFFILFFDQSITSILITVFVVAVAVQSFTSWRSLKTLKRNLQVDPERYRDHIVPKPILYHAVFWFLPK